MSFQVHQSYYAERKARVKFMVNQFLHSSFIYLFLGFYFTQNYVTVPNFVTFFQHMSEKKHEQAEKLLTFQTHSGEGVMLQDILKNGEQSLCHGFQLEKSVTQVLLGLYQIASCHVHPHMCDFLGTHYFDEELKLIKKLGDHITILKQVSAAEDGLGEYFFDHLTLNESSD